MTIDIVSVQKIVGALINNLLIKLIKVTMFPISLFKWIHEITKPIFVVLSRGDKFLWKCLYGSAQNANKVLNQII